MTPELVVLGNVSRDTIYYGGVMKGTTWGGAGLNISISAARLGLRPKLVSAIGQDGLELIDLIADHVDTGLIKLSKRRTCRFELRYSVDGVLESIRPEWGSALDIERHFKSIGARRAHYHICCRLPLAPENLLPQLAAIDTPFSLDFIITSIRQQAVQAQRWVGLAKYVFINASEFASLAQICSIDRIETLIVTAGRQPVRVFRFGSELLSRACPEKKAYEVTGAGDVFIGAFLACQLKGDGLPQSLESAIGASQDSLSALGAMGLLAGMRAATI